MAPHRTTRFGIATRRCWCMLARHRRASTWCGSTRCPGHGSGPVHPSTGSARTSGHQDRAGRRMFPTRRAQRGQLHHGRRPRSELCSRCYRSPVKGHLSRPGSLESSHPGEQSGLVNDRDRRVSPWDEDVWPEVGGNGDALRLALHDLGEPVDLVGHRGEAVPVGLRSDERRSMVHPSSDLLTSPRKRRSLAIAQSVQRCRTRSRVGNVTSWTTDLIRLCQ